MVKEKSNILGCGGLGGGGGVDIGVAVNTVKCI